MYLLFAGNKKEFIEALKQKRPGEIYVAILSGTLSNGVPRQTLYSTFLYRDGMIAMYRNSAVGFDDKKIKELEDEAQELKDLGKEVGYQIVNAVLTFDLDSL